MKIIAREQEEDPAAAESKSKTRRALTALSLSMLLASLGTSIVNVGLPALATAFHASFQQVQWVVLAYLLAITTLIVGVGRLGDITGRRRLLLSGIFLFTFASFLCGVLPLLWMLIAARIVQGIGAAIMMALTMALVGEAVPKERTGQAMGLLGTMSAIGTALGPSLGGILISEFGWRAIFILNLPLGIVALFLAHHHLPVDRAGMETKNPAFDIAGVMLLALTLGSYALAMTTGRGPFGLKNIALLLGSVFGIVLFVRAEKRAATPLISMRMFRDPALNASLGTSMLVSTVVMGTLVVGPFYLSRALQLDEAAVGLVMTVGPVTAAVTSVLAGRLTDRFGVRQVTVIGLTGMAGGSLMLSLVPPTLAVLGYVTPIAIVTASYALFQTANNTAVMKNTRSEQRGVISGLLNLSRNVGLITGTSLLGAVFAWASGAADIATASAEAVSRGTHITFAFAAILIVLAVAITLRSHAMFAFIRPALSAATMIAMLAMPHRAQGQTTQQITPLQSGVAQPITSGSSPAVPSFQSPYPLKAAGWEPEAGNGLFVSRWAEKTVISRRDAPLSKRKARSLALA